MADMKTKYLGLTLKNPVVVAASSLTATPGGVKKAADAGAGAVVLKSLFEEQLRADIQSIGGSAGESHPEADAYLAEMGMHAGSGEYLKLIREAKAAADIPVIASVNCIGGPWWTEFAEQVGKSGADALELNIAFLSTSPDETASSLEDRVVQIVRTARTASGLPVSVKLGSQYTNLLNLASRLSSAGAGGLVLFNRFFRMDIDLSTLGLVAGPVHSKPEDYHESLRWISLLFGRVPCDLAAGTGVHDSASALKVMLAGARAVQVCSVVYQKGYGVIREILTGMETWLDQRKASSLDDIRGKLSRFTSRSPADYERLQYIKALTGIY